jgi:DNA-binding MarR family transcriptional regulator
LHACRRNSEEDKDARWWLDTGHEARYDNRRRVLKDESMKRSSPALRRPTPRGLGERQIDFDELPSYVGYQVRRTQAAIFADFEAALANVDFTPGSFGVLTLIRANPGITQVALAAAFGVDKSTMSPVIVRLEKRGLVRREVLPSDRRCHALYLEKAAEAQFRAAREKVRALEGSVASRLSRPEQRELARLLAKLRGGGAEGQG